MDVALQLFYQAANELEDFIFQAATQELVDALVAAEPGPAAEDALFGLFAEYMVQNYSAELQTYRCTHSPVWCICLYHAEVVSLCHADVICLHHTEESVLSRNCIGALHCAVCSG